MKFFYVENCEIDVLAFFLVRKSLFLCRFFDLALSHIRMPDLSARIALASEQEKKVRFSSKFSLSIVVLHIGGDNLSDYFHSLDSLVRS